ncbi:peptidoglycan-binding protein [Streptomyces sp. x-80]|uniref:peptidoglycan-binding protein n=1 Tax=Streptomyces sp. x-80 TaxID=2789282 RepID=UPI00397FD8AE
MTRRRALVLAAATAALAVTGGGFAVNAMNEPSGKDSGTQAGSRLPQSTAEVRRADLNAAVHKPGKLGFAAPQKISAGAQGVLTWLPKGGSTVTRGGKLYEVSGQPVFLMYGERPMYRELKEGDTGEDVRQLKQNLRALGYGGGLAADDKFTPGTAKGLKAWQKAKGVTQTGKATPGQIAFGSGALRIDKSEASLGTRLAPGSAVLSATGAGRIVEFEVTPAEAGRLKADGKAIVALPDGTKAGGSIADIGRDAKGPDKDGGPDGGEQDPKFTVTVEFDHPDQVKGIDQAPVTVHLPGESRKNVLSVPVEALVALPGGGFGVQVVDNGRTREVRVDMGLFADGRVEVSGGGLREGMKVGVPK